MHASTFMHVSHKYIFQIGKCYLTHCDRSRVFYNTTKTRQFTYYLHYITKYLHISYVRVHGKLINTVAHVLILVTFHTWTGLCISAFLLLYPATWHRFHNIHRVLFLQNFSMLCDMYFVNYICNVLCTWQMFYFIFPRSNIILFLFVSHYV